LPDTLILREVRYHTKLRRGRTRIITLVTTLLDADAYSAEDLAALYGQRWGIETNLSYLKTTMGIDVLHCRSVNGVLKEMTVYAIAYNLIRLVMLKAASQQKTSVCSISFIDASRWLSQACHAASPLRLVVNPRRPHRLEPRACKRRPKAFDLMTRPRNEMRQRLLSKSVKN
jgi:hypothetical protein